MGAKHLITSESVTKGHPDKVADQISDAILDAMLAQDRDCHVACETLVTTGLVVVAGEITTKAYVDIPSVVRRTVRGIGYDDPKYGFDGESCAVITSIDEQSPDIDQGVKDRRRGSEDEQGAGDQGIMFGYATGETGEFMPLPMVLARNMTARMSSARESGGIPWMGPDGKSQVTVEYEGEKAVRVHTVVCSAQHSDSVDIETVRRDLREKIVLPCIPSELAVVEPILHLNRTGRFVKGGPVADCGVTGRKIIVDTYGGVARHGGGAFSGKDPSKVDRSATYAARWVAKNVVAAGLAGRCEVHLAYCIGHPDPVSIRCETFGTGAIPDSEIEAAVQEVFGVSLRPGRIISRLDLLRPIYEKTAANGHFGLDDPDYTWERLDMVDELRRFAK